MSSTVSSGSVTPSPAARPAKPGGGGPRRGRRRQLLGRNPLGLLLSAPYLIFVLLVFAYPLVFAFYMSFHDYFFAAPGAVVDRPFVGLANFQQVLTDPAVVRSFGNVGIFLLINVPLTVVLSLVLATALNKIVRARTFLRVSFYVPYVTASVAVVVVWLFLFNSNGLVNQILGPLAPDPTWLINPLLAMPTIAIFVTWKQMGFFILLYLAALQNVSDELYEAAATDGAGKIRMFFSITVPGVRPATVLVLLLATVTGANLFTEPYLLTGGGIAAAIGVILVIGVLILAFAQRKLAGGDES
jgi:multiple sugar transport system permease protein